MLTTDQMGRTVDVPDRPLRIVSIVPSQSEFLWDLGLGGRLAGITRFCVHPQEMFRTVERAGGTKQLHLDRIRAMKPDLIIGNKEENAIRDIQALEKEFPVWMSDIVTLDDAMQMMSELARICNAAAEGEVILRGVRRSLEACSGVFCGKRAAYVIWKDPYMLAGAGTFIHSMLAHTGLHNSAEHLERYPEVSSEDIRAMQPELLLLSSEPYPFSGKHIAAFTQEIPSAKIMLVDGEMFSWYGSRLQYAGEYMKKLSEMIC